MADTTPTLPATPTVDGTIPLPAGPHAWLWKLSEVRDWDATFKKARDLGFAGLHLHSTGSALRAAITRDLVVRARQHGLFIGASLAFDTGDKFKDAAGKETKFVGTPRAKLLEHVLRVADLLGPGTSVCLNWETRWERRPTHPDRRADAAWLAAEMIGKMPQGVALWDAPWWWPGMHGSAPTDEFGRAMAFRAPQTYYAYAKKGGGTALLAPPAKWLKTHPKDNNPPAYMVGRARHEYGRRDVKRPMAWAFQATAGANAQRYIGYCLREHPVTVWWHFLRLYEKANAPALALFRAAAQIDANCNGATFGEKVANFQRAQKLPADGWLADATVAKARAVFGP